MRFPNICRFIWYRVISSFTNNRRSRPHFVRTKIYIFPSVLGMHWRIEIDWRKSLMLLFQVVSQMGSNILHSWFPRPSIVVLAGLFFVQPLLESLDVDCYLSPVSPKTQKHLQRFIVFDHCVAKNFALSFNLQVACDHLARTRWWLSAISHFWARPFLEIVLLDVFYQWTEHTHTFSSSYIYTLLFFFAHTLIWAFCHFES